MKKTLLSIFSLMLLLTVTAQNYDLCNCSPTMLITTGTDAVSGDNKFSGAITIPFSFSFYGVSYSNLYVSTNGFIVFKNPNSTTDNLSTFTLPNSNAQAYIALAQAHLIVNSSTAGTTNSIYYQTIGTSPYRTFIIHFQDVYDFASNSSAVTGEIQLFEGSDEVRIISQSTTLSNTIATMGIARGDNGTFTAIYNHEKFTSTQQGYSFTPNGALPVKLIDFNVLNNKNNSNRLNWNTANETDTRFFEIERSVNGTSFIKVASVSAAINSTVTQQYVYDDKYNFLTGTTYYYRLKMVDQNMGYTYSPIVIVSSKNHQTINVSPNPFTDKVVVNIVDNIAAVAKIIITTMDGNKVFDETKNIEAGENNIEVNLAKIIVKGVYLLHINTQHSNAKFKIVKQ